MKCANSVCQNQAEHESSYCNEHQWSASTILRIENNRSTGRGRSSEETHEGDRGGRVGDGNVGDGNAGGGMGRGDR